MRTLPRNIKEAKLKAEEILNNLGLNFGFIGMSDTNGLSVYFRIGELKVRFSDHSVSNPYRMANEVCFSFQANEFSLSQSILKLMHELGDSSIIYTQIDYIRQDGKVLKAFGYKRNN